jgi:hypothetical protein
MDENFHSKQSLSSFETCTEQNIFELINALILGEKE